MTKIAAHFDTNYNTNDFTQALIAGSEFVSSSLSALRITICHRQVMFREMSGAG
jgi:hypothetical protein